MPWSFKDGRAVESYMTDGVLAMMNLIVTRESKVQVSDIRSAAHRRHCSSQRWGFRAG